MRVRTGLLAATMGLGGAGLAAIMVAAAPGVGEPKPVAAPPAAGPVAPMQIGMNLGSQAYYSSELPFADIVQSTGSLVATPPQGWIELPNPASPVGLDGQGRPQAVSAGTELAVRLQVGAGRLPAGDYDCRVSPGWNTLPWGAWTKSGSDQRFRMTVQASGENPNVVLRTVATRNGARLDELSCRMAGVPAGETFNPAFLSDVRPFGVLRFMQWMNANNGGPRRWAMRTTPASFSQAQPDGVAVEHMVALANRLRADPWFTLPLEADTDYYRRFATYVRDNLSPDRKVYVELSNEVWNDGFPQGKLALKLGQERYPGTNPQEAADFYYADRVIELMDLWTGVFGAHKDRLVRVIASQAVWPARIERTVAHADAWRHVDAVATAPYFGTEGREVPGTGAAHVDGIFAATPRVVDEAIGLALAAKAIAAKRGLRYVAYEGGPGYASYQPSVQAELMKVQNDPRMEATYRAFLTRWKRDVGDLLVVFDNVSTPGPAGWWGHRLYTGQPLAEALKSRALLDRAWGARPER